MNLPPLPRSKDEIAQQLFLRYGDTIYTGPTAETSPPPAKGSSPAGHEPCPHCGRHQAPTNHACVGCGNLFPARIHPCIRCNTPNRLTWEQWQRSALCQPCTAELAR